MHILFLVKGDDYETGWAIKLLDEVIPRHFGVRPRDVFLRGRGMPGGTWDVAWSPRGGPSRPGLAPPHGPPPPAHPPCAALWELKLVPDEYPDDIEEEHFMDEDGEEMGEEDEDGELPALGAQ